jgi:hypothetical protein
LNKILDDELGLLSVETMSKQSINAISLSSILRVFNSFLNEDVKRFNSNENDEFQ